MANTPTYSIELPDPGQDADTWGTILNNALISFEEYIDGTSTQFGTTISGGDITATRAVLSTDVTITDATITADSITTGPLTLSDKVTETVGTMTGATPDINPGNGTIQTWNMSSNGDPEFASFNSGESVTLGIITNGFTLSWDPAIQWVGGGVPVPDDTVGATNWYTLWKVGATYYGIYSGAST
jgi:hypothetical protein